MLFLWLGIWGSLPSPVSPPERAVGEIYPAWKKSGAGGGTYLLSHTGLCRRSHGAPALPFRLSAPRSVRRSLGSLLRQAPGPGRGGDWYARLRFEPGDCQTQGKVQPRGRGGASRGEKRRLEGALWLARAGTGGGDSGAPENAVTSP